MLLILALLAANVSLPDAVVLADPAQVDELCAALSEQGGDLEGDPAEMAAAHKAALARREEALSRWYRLEVPSKGFVFGRYRPQDKLLELDGDRPLRALDGVISLDLEGVDDVAFIAKPEQVSAWSREKKAGTLKLVVVFKPSGDRCAGSRAAEAWRLAGKTRSWELVASSGMVASADAEGDPVGAPGPRAVKVEKVALESDVEPPRDEGRERLASVQRALNQCGAGAPRPGSLLVTFAVQGGRVRDAQVIMDSLRDEKVSACVANALYGAPVGGSGRGTAAISLE
jgi:hypothetical protein